MIIIEATLPCLNPPAWALAERALFTLLQNAIQPFLAKYTDANGHFFWRSSLNTWQLRDGIDDFYEPFFNWPLLYLLGGDDSLLPLAHRQWEAMTEQLTALGMLKKEYDRGYDQFHQSEGNLFFYFLCLADPTHPLLLERARRFAGFYLNEDPEAPNYDPERHLIRAPHNGSEGPRWGYFDQAPSYNWRPRMAPYGLPYHDIMDIAVYEDLKDAARASQMGEAMQARMGRGDVATNLLVTSLITNAYLLTGEEKYRQWVLDYVDAWIARAHANGGLVPDNVGLSGAIGEYIDGKWYGGLYGWTWPHGFHCVGAAVLVAAANATVMTGETSYLDLPRTHLDYLLKLGVERDLNELEMSLSSHWIGIMQALGETKRTLVIPYRYGDHGWFDLQPVAPEYPVALWTLSLAESDWQRLEYIQQSSNYDWRTVIAFRNKSDSGHEAPWIRFLQGDNPAYPEAILSETYGQVCRRLELIRQDQQDLMQVHIHHWQDLNPVITEALVQLTLGTPAVIYNGGLLNAAVRYFDAQRKRPGLPPDTAALVETITAHGVKVHLVNLSPFETHDVIVQAGAFGEHQILTASFDERISPYPGLIGSYTAPALETVRKTIAIGDQRMQVHLPPATYIILDLELQRFARQPSYTLPW